MTIAPVPFAQQPRIMDDQSFTLPVLYIRHIADQLRVMGADVDAWLLRSNVTPASFDDPTFAVSYPMLTRLVANALEVAREPALGLFVGARLEANAHGMLGYGALHSGTIRQALDLVERFTRLRTALLTISHVTEGEWVHVRFDESHPLGDIRRPLLEAVVLSIKNVVDTISMGTCPVLRVDFAFEAPAYAALARELFSCDVHYGQRWSGFTLPVAALDAPLKLADPDAYREAALICERELEKLTANASLAGRVRRLLLQRQTGFPSLQVTARLFHLTPRTLHRRLLDEGTSYRELLEQVRHTLAIEHLKSGHFTIEEVAYTLGYSDLANFRRAFKRWESVPPSTYRSRHATPRRVRATG